MSSFLTIASTAFAALDTAFGDPLVITPSASSEFLSGGPDPANPPFIAVGILDLEGVIVDDSGGRSGTRSELSTTTPIAEFAFTQFGTGRPEPSAGDRIDAPTNALKPPTNGFTVLSRLPDGADGRMRFQLAELP